MHIVLNVCIPYRSLDLILIFLCDIVDMVNLSLVLPGTQVDFITPSYLMLQLMLY